jgi:hypothetical protein
MLKVEDVLPKVSSARDLSNCLLSTFTDNITSLASGAISAPDAREVMLSVNVESRQLDKSRAELTLGKTSSRIEENLLQLLQFSSESQPVPHPPHPAPIIEGVIREDVTEIAPDARDVISKR